MMNVSIEIRLHFILSFNILALPYVNKLKMLYPNVSLMSEASNSNCIALNMKTINKVYWNEAKIFKLFLKVFWIGSPDNSVLQHTNNNFAQSKTCTSTCITKLFAILFSVGNVSFVYFSPNRSHVFLYKCSPQIGKSFVSNNYIVCSEPHHFHGKTISSSL